MHIWLIQIGEPLPISIGFKKLRTLLLADKLIEKGHTITWWASTFDHFNKKWLHRKDSVLRINENLEIIMLKGLGYKKNVSLSRYVDHRILSRKFRSNAGRYNKPDVIIASMPAHDFAYEAVIFAKKNRIPVIVDIRDPWPDIFLNHFSPLIRFAAKMLLCKDFRMVERTMRSSDGIVAVSNAFLEWGLNYARRKRSVLDKVIYLGGIKNLLPSINSERIEIIMRQLEGKFIVSFIGTFANYHNPSILMDCAASLSDSDIHFVIAGNGENVKSIKKVVDSLHNVTLLGWLNNNEIDALLCHSSIGVCPSTQHIDLFPNKAITYLSASLPIISAFQGDLKDITEKHKIGFYYPPNDVDALVNCILTLYNDRELYKQMSENARRIFDERFDADKIYEDYAEHIEKVASEYKRK